ncbi:MULTISPECIES: flagellar assembly protein FliH [unclassified Colwellia]|uniref:flagellar assembly protein FliH n=1 Tax=unclassified Colwellia TaxID=196834 RepID=UPI0015F56BDB|nr:MULTISPECIES: flagellar assembly protein FliH [unclassified Colwellia]MBA6233419.1 flagellar assembly protein FliH [Colwellia sp. MB02u-7]MBA6236509.1 flagellar assembly protein FliH [Colwellia sp. MB02u-11]MBA6257043.1 flagellar assembly protein FliH [Colwellia sp. MB3u-28]MBA6260952.1 flagellar assembly protein FliH [Colwellia sp. MB3u-41]MBA6298092.1 flagellar assembly protein FliH [Colwellia sp. MB3u-22]
MKILNKTNADIIKHDLEQETDVWSLPTVEPENKVKDETTNAMGKKTAWRFEPPEDIVEEEIAPLTAEDIENIRQAAFDEGFSQGKEEGFAKGHEEGKVSGHEEGVVLGHKEGVETGLAEGEKSIEEQSAAWQSLTEQLHKPLLDVEKNVEQQLLHLVVQLTEAVTLQEAKTNPDIIIGAISAGIKALPSQEAQTQILLHPDDIKRVEKQFGADHVQEQGWRLLAAPQLVPGSCQIENSTSNVDLSVKSRMKEVLDSFLQDALHQ